MAFMPNKAAASILRARLAVLGIAVVHMQAKAGCLRAWFLRPYGLGLSKANMCEWGPDTDGLAYVKMYSCFDATERTAGLCSLPKLKGTK